VTLVLANRIYTRDMKKGSCPTNVCLLGPWRSVQKRAV